MSINLCHIFGKCSLFHNMLQYRFKESSRLMVCSRKLHIGLLLKDNLSHRTLLLPSFNITDVAKRNASKKAKGKKKGGGSGGGSNRIDLSVGADVINLREIQDGMLDVTTKLADEFKRKYAPKLTANILDNIPIKIDGRLTPLLEVGTVNSHDTEFLIEPSSSESRILIMDALKKELNVDPLIVGANIRIPVSIASSEYKENILKLAKASAEKSKVDIRKIRQLAMNISKKHGGSKDNIKLIDEQIQNLTNKFSNDVENMVVQKKLELNPGKDPRPPNKRKS